MEVDVNEEAFKTPLDTTVETSPQMTSETPQMEETVVNAEAITMLQVPAEASDPNTAEGDTLVLEPSSLLEMTIEAVTEPRMGSNDRNNVRAHPGWVCYQLRQVRYHLRWVRYQPNNPTLLAEQLMRLDTQSATDPSTELDARPTQQ
ncbi:hypothetical protein PF005_g15322 [Phytophthora fragariae]|uniref:Uncharacterized protein n=1 Tax=Phytophthora fragariae TaxID=53985 RepID=A0A6A3IJC6_9STRA|nr:hypothetical protein PF003_g24883 [Phytophthora fragariae]KAE8935038.1 hypothetical protein PF009_g14999 [Phytophthora fragariae]KAE8982107.1 hypothetical protein PF011_g21756 [Phytophthora fragariae]KAE9080222.1 hypothetical protein PF010_g22464 [Phytophthora fragariae]KAE9104526.1 hypothetical protein PF007_g14022 [Phytophthora fragariae]